MLPLVTETAEIDAHIEHMRFFELQEFTCHTEF